MAHGFSGHARGFSMRKLGHTKLLFAGCSVIAMAAFLAVSYRAAENPGRPFGRPTLISRSTANVSKRYGQLPLAFEPSSSPSNDRVKFLARGGGYALFLTNDEAVLELRGHSKTRSVLRMELAGANASAQFTATEELPGKSNYFIGNNPRNWRTNVPQYRRVSEGNVYPGVNLVYYGTQGRLEYDFDVAPGIDPSVIRLGFKGADRMRLDAQGELILDTASGEVRLRKPVAYQEIAGSRQPVAVGYALTDKSSASFQVAKYDSRLPLVIDPILAYSTYLGGSNIDSGNAIAVAPDNTAFIAGGTFSSDFPTVHALQPNEGGGPDFSQDAFVAKISSDGSTLLYSTYLGGENQDVANGIAVDAYGDAYVTGTTLSPHFPVTPGSFNTECGGDGRCGASFNNNGLIVSNAFVTELNAAGSGIIYSGFLGMYENVHGEAIAVDANGNAYVTGETQANIIPGVAVFPITTDAGNTAFETTFAGSPTNPTSTNAFVTKIGAAGSTILYSSYLGGNTEDVGYGIAVDGSANAYVTGLTYSSNFPATTGALQTAYGLAGDAFVTKVNTDGSGATSLVYSTFLGGSGLDQGNGIALDSSGDVYVTGLTNSAAFGFTAPAGGYQPANAGEGDAFIAELNTSGGIAYFTFLGGSNADAGTGIAVGADSTGHVYAYITGTTVSTNFPPAGAVFQPAYGGGNADSFVAKLGPLGLTPTGATLVYSSYLGGTNTELASGIAVDTSGSAYVTGQTCSSDFPLANPLQAVPGGNCDAYIAKVTILDGIALSPSGLIFPAQSLMTMSQSQTVTLTNGDTPQTIASIAISGNDPNDFMETNTCPLNSSLAVGATCTVTVTFFPTATGIREASLVITDSTLSTSQVVNLTGNTSTVTLSKSSLSFQTQQVGVPSAPQDVTVTNSGNTPLTISSIAASGDFSETDNCTKTALPATTTCVIQVTFTPSAPVNSIGAITLTDTGSGSPQEILAYGTGVLQPQASLSAASLGFPAQSIGSASSSQQVTLSNTGDAPLNISGIVVTGDFSQTNTCGSILSASGSCTINITFTPSATGTRTGILTVTDNTANVAGSTQTVQLSGTGQAVSVVSLSTATLTFSGQAIGTTSAAQTVTLTNTGSAPLDISSITSSGDFTQISNCPTSVAAGSKCTISVTFTPVFSGNRFGTITITDNALTSPQTISLSGVGNATPVAFLPTGSLTFTSQLLGTPSAAQVATLTNTGSVALAITSIVASGDFSQSNNCGTSLAGGSTCSISVTFTPTAVGTRTGSITITDNAVPATQSVSLSGSGAAFQITSTTATPAVPAGQTANYSLMIYALGGFGQQVNLTCTAPATISCGLSPSTATPSASTPVPVTLVVSTQLRTIAPPGPRIKIDPFGGFRHFTGTWLAWLAVVLTLVTIGLVRRRPISAAFGFAVVLLMVMGACSGSGTPGVPVGTPAGTYQITVTGTSGSVTSSTQLTLQVN
jgi:hypothetical protein